MKKMFLLILTIFFLQSCGVIVEKRRVAKPLLSAKEYCNIVYAHSNALKTDQNIAPNAIDIFE